MGDMNSPGDEGSAQPPPDPARKENSGDPQGPRLRVLVADDNEVNRLVIGGMLAKGNYEIHFVFDGLQAVDAFRRLSPDIVLMDVCMPNMDGLEATAQIRTLEAEGRRAKVFGLTAFAMEGDRQSLLDCGMDDYLPKPVRYESLMALLQS
jgi:CheY-like chemotaxis protein